MRRPRSLTRLFDRFEFYHDREAKWRWRRMAMDGNLMDASARGWKDKADCLADAVEHGYNAER